MFSILRTSKLFSIAVFLTSTCESSCSSTALLTLAVVSPFDFSHAKGRIALLTNDAEYYSKSMYLLR